MKYQVKFAETNKPETVKDLSFEVDGKTYREGDTFEPPANWQLNMDGFIGYGVRFAEPYQIYDETEGKMVDHGDWRFNILPVIPLPEPERKKKNPEGG